MQKLIEHPQSFLIIDDFLEQAFDASEFDELAKRRSRESGNTYNWTPVNQLGGMPNSTALVLNRACSYVGMDAQQLLGVEYWANRFVVGDEIKMHSDIDEMRFRKTRRLACGLMGVVYYASCSQLIGGDLHFEDGIMVAPRKNRCVLFFGGTRHAVTPVRSGVRETLVMSLWDEIPLAYVDVAAAK